MKEIARFHKYVRPILNPKLTDFCIELTGITQEVVDAADTFDRVYHEFQQWLESNIISDINECVFVTDGPWDLRDFMEKELTYYGYQRPTYMNQIIDIRKVFEMVYLKPSGNLSNMLAHLKFSFQGREHSGIDDTFNISRIFLQLVRAGHRMDVTTNLKKHKATRGQWRLMIKSTTI